MARRVIKDAQKKTARERITILFAEAEKRPAYAKRYMQIIKRLQTRYRLRLKAEENRRICKKCLAFLVPGRNATVRTKGHIVVTCNECGFVRRFPYGKEKRRKV